MDLSDPDSLLRRVRWPNVARLAALVVLAALAVLVPRLSNGSPAVPTGVAVPVLDLGRQVPVIVPAAPKVKAVPEKVPAAAPVHHKRAHRRRPRRHRRRAHGTVAPTRSTVHARLAPARPAPAPRVQLSPSYDSTTEFNPAAHEFG